MDDRRQLPNVCERSGLSADYMIALGSVRNFVERVERGESPRAVFLAKRTLKHRVIVPYIEHFRALGYLDIENDRNQRNILELDQVVVKMNLERENIKLSSDDLESEASKMHELLDKAREIVLYGK